MNRIYWAYARMAHIITFRHQPQWLVPGLYCAECALQRLR